MENSFLYILYYIEKKIITYKQISLWADRMLFSNKETIPYVLIQLSEAKSLDEQFIILFDEMNCEQLNFSNLNPLYIISYLNCYYQLQNEKVISIINIIFHLKDDINVEKILLQDIYILDDYCDTFLSNVISIEELKKHVHFFFLKYSVKIPDVLQFFF